MSNKPLLSAQNIFKKYGEETILEDVSVAVHEAEIHAFMGRSGVGKTTLLKIMAGLLAPETGQVVFQDRVLDNPDEVLVPGEEELAYVAQDFRLLKNRTVAENLKDALLAYEVEFRNQQMETLLQLMRLSPLADKRIEKLSGGEKQRLAIARAMATQPDVLLLDEPFTQLDKSTRQLLMDTLKDIRKELSTTILFVTHDVNEAFYLADTIHIMEDRKLMQSGSPLEVYRAPAQVKIANLLGLFNVLPLGALEDWDKPDGLKISENAIYGVWPESVVLLDAIKSNMFCIAARVQSIDFVGSHFLIQVFTQGDVKLYIHQSKFTGKIGDSVLIGFEEKDLVIIGS
jgi:ABC-type sugar transport system ATPase subunit